MCFSPCVHHTKFYLNLTSNKNFMPEKLAKKLRSVTPLRDIFFITEFPYAFLPNCAYCHTYMPSFLFSIPSGLMKIEKLSIFTIVHVTFYADFNSTSLKFMCNKKEEVRTRIDVI